MRDAIQGMLSMSRMGSLQLFSGTTKPPAGVAKGVKQWEASQAEEEEQLGVCYKDEEYSKYFQANYIKKIEHIIIFEKLLVQSANILLVTIWGMYQQDQKQ